MYAAHYWWIRLEVIGVDQASACVIARGIFERGCRVEIVGAAVCAPVRVDKLARDVGHQSAVVTIWLLTNRLINLRTRQVARFPSSKEAIV